MREVVAKNFGTMVDKLQPFDTIPAFGRYIFPRTCRPRSQDQVSVADSVRSGNVSD